MSPHEPATDEGPADPVGDRPALTWVDLAWYEGRLQWWIRFGKVRDEHVQDRRRRRVAFAADDVFAYVRWRAGERGTVQSRIDILRVARTDEPLSTLPGVAPGGEILLHLSGWRRVRRALAAIDGVELASGDPADAAPDHWRHVHNRLSAGLEPRPYTPLRHRAWRLRTELAS
jgi:hypothetical protein